MAIWERQTEREMLWRHFNRGRNVALFAPRRLGKTWLMKAIENEAQEKGYLAVFIDLEAETSAKGAVRTICKAISGKNVFNSLWEQAKSRMTNILQGDTVSGNYQELLLKADWESMLYATLKALNGSDTPGLILVDEVSVCLSSLLAVSREEGAAFMRRLREHRQEFSNIRWMLTGSIGLDHVAEQYGLGGTLNELEPFPLKPLTPEEAADYVNHLCTERKLPLPDADTHQQMQGRLGWLAHHYLYRLLDRIEDRVTGNKIEPSHVNQACDALLSYPYNRVFSDWPDHINRNYPDEQKRAAHKLLNLLCRHSDGESIESIRNSPSITGLEIDSIHTTLAILQNDGFLCHDPDTGRYRFVFGLLREYWMRFQSL